MPPKELLHSSKSENRSGKGHESFEPRATSPVLKLVARSCLLSFARHIADNGLMTRAFRTAGWIMIGLGVLIMAFLAYQLVGTNILTARSQDRAQETVEEHFVAVQEEIEVVDTIPPPQIDDNGSTDPQPDPAIPQVVHYSEPTPDEGLAFGVMTIPKIDADHVLF